MIIDFEPDYAVPPGETLAETLKSLQMPYGDLAQQMGTSVEKVLLILKGEAPITPDVSVVLERVTGIPVRMWNNLEANYRKQLAKVAKQTACLRNSP